uniref:Uncharacterized protein n=1 Tax=Aegilops tauschii subsp. strangulata TaxID=200361 RepID=A0A452Z4G2_AEGTS
SLKTNSFVVVFLTDKFTVASFLEALEDSVAKASTDGGNDSKAKKDGGNDPMDEG